MSNALTFLGHTWFKHVQTALASRSVCFFMVFPLRAPREICADWTRHPTMAAVPPVSIFERPHPRSTAEGCKAWTLKTSIKFIQMPKSTDAQIHWFCLRRVKIWTSAYWALMFQKTRLHHHLHPGNIMGIFEIHLCFQIFQPLADLSGADFCPQKWVPSAVFLRGSRRTRCSHDLPALTHAIPTNEAPAPQFPAMIAMLFA